MHRTERPEAPASERTHRAKPEASAEGPIHPPRPPFGRLGFFFLFYSMHRAGRPEACGAPWRPGKLAGGKGNVYL